MIVGIGGMVLFVAALYLISRIEQPVEPALDMNVMYKVIGIIPLKKGKGAYKKYKAVIQDRDTKTCYRTIVMLKRDEIRKLRVPPFFGMYVKGEDAKLKKGPYVFCTIPDVYMEAKYRK